MKIARPLTSNASKEKLGEKELKQIYIVACRRLLCLSATYIQVSLIIASFMLLLMSTKVCPEIKNLSIDPTLCYDIAG